MAEGRPIDDDISPSGYAGCWLQDGSDTENDVPEKTILMAMQLPKPPGRSTGDNDFASVCSEKVPRRTMDMTGKSSRWSGRYPTIRIPPKVAIAYLAIAD